MKYKVLAMTACWTALVAVEVTAQRAPIHVYETEASVPCAFESLDPLAGTVAATSLGEYIAERNRFFETQAAELDADGVLIPEDRPEPGRGGYGFTSRRVGGVRQAMAVHVEGVAIRFLEDGCRVVDPLGDAQIFEGVARYEVVVADVERRVVTNHIRGTLVRSEDAVSYGTRARVMDEVAGRGVELSPGSAVTAFRVASTSLDDLSVTDLERTDTVAGIDCRLYRMLLDESDVEVCVASGYGVTSGGIMPPGYGLAPLADAFPDGFLPLRTSGVTFGVSVEVTALSVEPGPVDDALFDPLAPR